MLQNCSKCWLYDSEVWQQGVGICVTRSRSAASIAIHLLNIRMGRTRYLSPSTIAALDYILFLIAFHRHEKFTTPSVVDRHYRIWSDDQMMVHSYKVKSPIIDVNINTYGWLQQMHTP